MTNAALTNPLSSYHSSVISHISMLSSTITILITTLLPIHFSFISAARKPLDLDKHTRHKSSSSSPGPYDVYGPVSSHRDYSPDYSSTEPKRSRYPKQDPTAPHSHSRYPEHYLLTEGGRSRHADPYPEHLLPSRGKHGDRYPNYESTETGRARGLQEDDTERVVRRKERPVRPPSPQYPTGREKEWVKERDRNHDRHRDRDRDLELERQMGRDRRRDREHDLRGARVGERDRERSRDRGQSGGGHRVRDRQRQRDEQVRTRSRERELDEDFLERVPRKVRASWEEDDDERERRARGRQRVHSNPEEVFDEHRSKEGRGHTKDFWDPQQGEGPSGERSHTHPNGETGTTLSLPLGSAGVFVWCAGVLFPLCQSQVVG